MLHIGLSGYVRVIFESSSKAVWCTSRRCICQDKSENKSSFVVSSGSFTLTSSRIWDPTLCQYFLRKSMQSMQRQPESQSIMRLVYHHSRSIPWSFNKFINCSGVAISSGTSVEHHYTTLCHYTWEAAVWLTWPKGFSHSIKPLYLRCKSKACLAAGHPAMFVDSCLHFTLFVFTSSCRQSTGFDPSAALV